MQSNNHIVMAKYSHTGKIKTRPVYRYDYGQILKLEGFEHLLPEEFEVHFAVANQESATVVIGNNFEVAIPDACLLEIPMVTAWLFLHDEETDGETKFTIETPVTDRAKPSAEEPTPVEQSVVTQTIAALNRGVSRAELAANNAEQAAETINQTIEDVRQDINDIRQDITDVRHNVTDVQQHANEIDVSIGYVHLNIDDINQNISDIRQDVSDVHQDINDIHQDINDIHQYINDIHQDSDGIHQDIDDINQDINNVKQDINQDIGNVNQSINGINQDLAGINQEIGDVKQDVNDIKQNIDDINQDVEDVKQDVDDTKQAVAEANQAAEDASLTANEAKDSADEAKQTAEGASQLANEAKQAADDVEAAIATKADKADTVLDTTLSRGRKEGTTVGTGSFAFGLNNEASGYYSHAEGSTSIASGTAAHAEGFITTASGHYSHAEGRNATASGNSSHSEGKDNVASGQYSHAEGTKNAAEGTSAHAEGQLTTASGQVSHAEGSVTKAVGNVSHAEGWNTVAQSAVQHVQGKCNVVDDHGTYADIVGSGTADDARSNAFALTWTGDGHYAGDVYTHSNPDSTGGNKLATEDYVDDAVSHISSMAIHICTSEEYNAETGVPTVANPDSTTFYLVPGGDSPNLYIEWVYVNDAWEKFGSATVDLSNYVQKTDYATSDNAGVMKVNSAALHGVFVDSTDHYLKILPAASLIIKNGVEKYKAIAPFKQHESTFYGLAKAAGDTTMSSSSNAVGTYTTEAKAAIQTMLDVPSNADLALKADKTDTVLETTISRGRKDNTTVGGASLAFGIDTEASGYYSVALGLNTTASSQGAFAEGKNTVAHYIAHAEGENTQALGQWSHSQGVGTVANGAASFAGGDYTIANGHASFVTGRYNAADSYNNWPTWTANTSYEVGDRVKRNLMVQNKPTDVGYHCTVANSDATFDNAHWELDGYHMNYVEIVGNGKEYEDPETHQTVRAGSNAYALDWDGNGKYAGDVYVHANPDSSGGEKLAKESDLSNKADKADTVLETTLSRGRTEGSVVGEASFAFGELVQANGVGSFAFGKYATAKGNYSFARGQHVKAYGENSVAEGIYSIALGGASHAEGGCSAKSTKFTGDASALKYKISQALPVGTVVINNNAPSGLSIIQQTEQENGVYYATLDYTLNENEAIADLRTQTYIGGALGPEAHSEGSNSIAIGNSQHVEGKNNEVSGDFAHIVGNGFTSTVRSNAYALSWEGDGKYAGDVYVHSNADSSGGIKLATVEDIPEVPVQDVQIDGISIVSNGIATIPIRGNIVSGSSELVTSNAVNSALNVMFGTTSNQIKEGTHNFRGIVPAKQHESVFYGLAKAAGDSTQSASSNAVGVYTDEAKAAIKAMLGITDGLPGPVEVSGATPTITATKDTRYVCGEVSTLTVTSPASGICIVRFTSGATPTVLTATGVVWPEWFDINNLEANTVYEICITDGVYGAVMTWPQTS